MLIDIAIRMDMKEPVSLDEIREMTNRLGKVVARYAKEGEDSVDMMWREAPLHISKKSEF